MGLAKVLHPDDVQKVNERWRSSIEAGRPHENTTLLRGKDGNYRWFLVRVTPIRDEQGNIQRWFGTNTDITKRKRAEEELSDAKAQAELYLDLMGHDINNMHQIALGYLELAREMPACEGQTESLDKSIQVLHRRARLIQNVKKLKNLRKMARSRQRKSTCARCSSDIQGEFGAVPNKSVSLNLNGMRALLVSWLTSCCMMCSPIWSSTRSSIRGSSADIFIKLEVGGKELDQWQYCRVSVEDNGPGIPDDNKSTIFNRALKGTAKAKGMGLGLVLSPIARGELRRPSVGRGPGAGRLHEGRQVRGHAARSR